MTSTYYIYKICCCDDSTNEFYIGSTVNISVRKYKHKSNCNGNKNNQKIYKTIRANGGWENWYMVVVEQIHNCSKIEARIREEQLRVELSATLNMCAAYCGLTPAERMKLYREQNPEQISEKTKIYREQNKEAISIQKKEYYEANKEQINNQQKSYYETNKEKISNQKKEYYQDHKEQRNQKNDCECGGKYTNGNKSTHMKSPMHKKFIQNNI